MRQLLPYTEILHKFLPQHKIIHAEVETKDILGTKFNIAGIALDVNGLEIIGASSGEDDTCLSLAAYECLERFAILSSDFRPTGFTDCKLSLSNGVAIHTNPQIAHTNALCEVMERHFILDSWFNNSPARKISIPNELNFSVELHSAYNLEVIEFSTAPGISIIGIFAFPKSNELNLIYGFGCGTDKNISISKAKKEFLTRLGYLWNETYDSNPADPTSPLFHQEFYLNPENIIYIKEWLKTVCYSNNISNYSRTFKFNFFPITPQSWRPELTVIRATSEDMIPLFFGMPSQEVFDFSVRHDIPHPIV